MKKYFYALLLLTIVFTNRAAAQVTASFVTPQCDAGSSAVPFADNSYSSSGTIVSWQWNFGDPPSGAANTSTLQNPFHDYPGEGSYIVTLIVQDNMGYADTATQVKYVSFYPNPFFIPNNNQCITGNNFYFYVNSPGTVYPVTHSWSFGDGATSISETATHTYTTPGTYNVKLVASTGVCIDSMTQTVTVDARPVAGFAVNNTQQCLSNNLFAFTNLTSIVTGGAPLTYYWDFNDGIQSTAINPTHVYAQAGTYAVSLAATSGTCSDVVTKLVMIGNDSTTIIDTAVCINKLPLILNSHYYYNPGTYSDTISNGGCIRILLIHLSVLPTTQSTTSISICNAQLPYHWNGLTLTSSGYYSVNLPSSFSCDSIAALDLVVGDTVFSYTNVGICTSQLPYIWNGTGYNAAGTYKKMFTSTAGCDSLATLNLSVGITPVANFAYTKGDNACGSLTKAFYNTGSGNFAFVWDFGDGTNSVDAYALHTFANYGTYPVKITVWNICGRDSITKPVNIALEANTILPASPKVLIANRECLAADSTWTNYYFDNNTPGNTDDDTLLLSLNKNGNYIGTIGDGTFQLKLVATAGAGSNTGILLTNPLITNPSGFWVMNRYWNVVPTVQPTTPVGVKFYFNTQDLNDVNGSFPTHNLNVYDLLFYKTMGGNPDPTSNLAGATHITSIVIGNAPDTTHWLSNYLGNNHYSAEFQVAHFSGGGGGATGNGQILPLQLVSFSAVKKGTSNLLQWTTNAEVDMRSFEVERSVNGVEFATIGMVNAMKNQLNNVNNAYTFTDKHPLPGANYYRLKMINKDGSFVYSVVRKLANISFDISIYPNPVKDLLTLTLQSDSRTKASMSMTDAAGKTVLSISSFLVNGTVTKSINIAYLPEGVYYLKTTTDADTYVQKVVKW